MKLLGFLESEPESWERRLRVFEDIHVFLYFNRYLEINLQGFCDPTNSAKWDGKKG
jgi:hypothetical protein